MENNTIKENCLEVIEKQDVLEISSDNTLPAIINKKELLPVVINQQCKELFKLKEEFYKIRKNNSIGKTILKILKKLVCIIAKIVYAISKCITKLVCFLAISAIVTMTTVILTKNIINYYCGAVPADDNSFSIFNMNNIEKKVDNNNIEENPSN